MVLVDYVVMIIIVVSTLGGIVRGMVRDAISLISWLLACGISANFAQQMPDLSVFNGFGDSEKVRIVVGFGVLFALVLLVGELLGWLAGRWIKNTYSKALDHVLGAAFGYARGASVLILLILLVNATSIPQSREWSASTWVVPYQQLALQTTRWMPQEVADYFILEAGK